MSERAEPTELTKIAAFNAKFKTIIVKSGDGIALLDFVTEDAAGAAGLLQGIGDAFELKVDEIGLASVVGYLKFNGDGKNYVRLSVDIHGSAGALQDKVDHDVRLEAWAK